MLSKYEDIFIIAISTVTAIIASHYPDSKGMPFLTENMTVFTWAFVYLGLCTYEDRMLS